MDSATATNKQRKTVSPQPNQAPAQEAPQLSVVKSGKTPIIPEYMQEIYYWAYLNPRNVRWLNRESIVRTILWQQHARLRASAFSEIKSGQKVLQSTCVYGKFLPMLAEHIGPDGHLDLVDIAEVQLLNAGRNLKGFNNVTLHHADVMDLGDEMYDTVVCYFLLHEVPDEHKRACMDVLLKKVRPGGKFVCIEYAKPHWAHPLKPITYAIWHWLEPFAKTMWKNEVRDFASNADEYRWRKETFFGSLFQKVVAERL